MQKGRRDGFIPFTLSFNIQSIFSFEKQNFKLEMCNNMGWGCGCVLHLLCQGQNWTFQWDKILPHKHKSCCAFFFALFTMLKQFQPLSVPFFLFRQQVVRCKHQTVLKRAFINLRLRVGDSSEQHLYWADIGIWRWSSLSANSTACTTDGFLNIVPGKHSGLFRAEAQLPYGTYDLWPVQTDTQYLQGNSSHRKLFVTI